MFSHAIAIESLSVVIFIIMYLVTTACSCLYRAALYLVNRQSCAAFSCITLANSHHALLLYDHMIGIIRE